MTYLLLKSLHIISMVAWFAGIFYLVRLFVYHTEAFDKNDGEKKILTQQFHIMETRLYKIICHPGMIFTWIFGIALIYVNGMEWFRENTWLHIKIVLVILLTVYHEYNRKIIRHLKEEKTVMTSFQFRLYNEIPFLFLASIVSLAIFKNLLQFGYAFASIIGFALVLFIFANIYKKLRTKNNKTN